MISFFNDYGQTGHDAVLSALQGAREQTFPGYGEDEVCQEVANQIRALCGAPEAAVHFLSGGTQANLTLIASVLRPHQGVICADTGHINAHETGAVEATGHKVLSLPHRNGQITPNQVRQFVENHRADPTREHTPQPGMVYISNTTELGTVYTRDELAALSACCHELSLPLYLDGARLGYALAAADDLSFSDIANYCDAFTIGGTKQGLLFGEALVITNPALQKDFRYHVKQRGGMLAKGFLMGLQFEAILKKDRYLSLARHANQQALRIRDAFRKKGIPFLGDSATNQQFPILDVVQIEMLSAGFAFSRIQPMENGLWAVRFCTSWATREEDVDSLVSAIERLP